jgi:hypothetical protein
MRTWMGAVLGALLAASSAQAAECQLKQFTSIDVTGLPDRILVPATFGDTPKTISLDLTMSLNYVAEATAKELRLKTRPTSSLLPNATFGAITRLAYAPKFQFGAVKGEDVEFMMLPQSFAQAGTDGRLGTKIFDKLDLELDMAHAKMDLFLPDHCPGKVVYWTKTGFAQVPYKKDLAEQIIVPMELDGQPVSVVLHTGGQSEIGMNAMRRLFKLDESSPGMTQVGSQPDGRKYYHYPFKTLVADGLTVGHPNILVRGEPLQEECNGRAREEDVRAQGHVTEVGRVIVTCYGGSDIRLGLSVLTKLRLYFSSQEKLIYLTGAGAQ